MGHVIGIDIGGSTTKIVGFLDGALIGTLKVKASDQMTSAYGAFGKFLSTHDLKITDIDRVKFTGVGATFIKENFYSLPTSRVNEFTSIGRGGQYLTNLDRAVIVSMGTGTAFVKMVNGEAVHLGGSGIGGGTVLGLADRMLGIRKFENLVDLAEEGSLRNVDLAVGDISEDVISNMPMETTASNFGRLSDLATHADIALGILNMVFQTVGLLAIFSARADKIRDIVLTGNLSVIPCGKAIFDALEALHSVSFHVPHHAEFATAIGAALS